MDRLKIAHVFNEILQLIQTSLEDMIISHKMPPDGWESAKVIQDAIKRGRSLTDKIYKQSLISTMPSENLGTNLIGKGETIFIVDDELDVIKICSRILKKFNYNPIGIESCDAVINKICNKKEKADIIILDLIMPETNGVMCANKLAECSPETKIIITTGAGPLACNGLINTNVVDILFKPYTATTLLLVLKKVLVDNPN